MPKLTNQLGYACLCAALLAAIGGASCAVSRAPEPLMGNTNWLSTCESEDECSDGLSCTCGLCTRECARTAECSDLGDAVCDSSSDARMAACGRDHNEGVCLPECSSELTCNDGLRCVDARCIPASIPIARDDDGGVPMSPRPDGGVDAGADAGADSGQTGGMACDGPNPAGCRQSGCPSGQRCNTDFPEVDCTPSNCECDPETGGYICTDDCGGGECVAVEATDCSGSLAFLDTTLEALVRVAIDKPDGDIVAADVEELTALDSEFSGVDGQVASLEGIQCLNGLTSLSLSNGEVSDLSPLAALSDLRFLTLNDHEVADVTPLGDLTALEGLFITRNLIRDVSALASLSALTELALENNRVVDITSLQQLSSLALLWLLDNPLDCDLNADAFEVMLDRGVVINAPACL